MRIGLLTGLMAGAAAFGSCSLGGGSCDFGLKQRLYFPAEFEARGYAEMPCCGASMYQDLNLTADDVQVDLINSSDANGGIDVFLTDSSCTRLFSGSYAGVTTMPLCTIYMGPVKRGGPAQRQSIRRGTYRVLEQAYTTNAESVRFLMEVGLWSDACRWSPVTP